MHSSDRRSLISAAITDSYVSALQPQFHFKSERLHTSEIEDFVRFFTERFEVTETTDLNVDCSRVLVLTREDNTWILWRSLVGPFVAVVHELDARTRMLVESATAADAPPSLASALVQYGCLLLTRDELSKPVRLRLDPALACETSTFAALFSETEYMPWESPR